MASIFTRLRHRIGLRPHPRLRRQVVEVRDLAELKKAFGWTRDPPLDDPTLDAFNNLTDLNQRRRRDAECIAAAMANAVTTAALEIGTAEGRTTALMARNAPKATVYTVNIAPEEIASGAGGVHVTHAFAREAIGAIYRQQGLANVAQILANTWTWQPDLPPIDLAFIDGCHDTRFVINDTIKTLHHLRPGGFILWHDFAPALAERYDWIDDVCAGVEGLLRRRLIAGPVLHVRDSWVGVCRVGAIVASP